MRSPFRREVTIVLAGLVLVFVACGVAALLGSPTWLDRTIMRGVLDRRAAHPGLTRFFETITLMGNEPYSLLIVVGAAATLAALAWRGFVKIGPRDVLYWLAVGLGGEMFNRLLKLGFRRDRPPEAGRLVVESSFSFPSGHSTFAATVFGLIALIALHSLRGDVARWYRRPIVLASVLAALLVAASRVWLGVHYPTDVLGGLALGTFWATAAWESWIGRRTSARDHAEAPP